MNAPIILWIASQKWTVREGPLSDGDMAMTHFPTNTITVRYGLPRDRFLASVWHELFHVFLFQVGVPLSERKEEAVAQGLGHALFDFISANDVIGDLTK